MATWFVSCRYEPHQIVKKIPIFHPFQSYPDSYFSIPEGHAYDLFLKCLATRTSKTMFKNFFLQQRLIIWQHLYCRSTPIWTNPNWTCPIWLHPSQVDQWVSVFVLLENCLEKWTWGCRDDFVGFNLLAGQGHINKVRVLSQVSKCTLHIVLEQHSVQCLYNIANILECMKQESQRSTKGSRK